MKTIAQLCAEYNEQDNAHDAQRAKLQTRLDVYERRATKLRAKLVKLYGEWPYWKTVIVEPLVAAVHAQIGGAEPDVYGPCGIGATVSAYINQGEEIVWAVSFRPRGVGPSLCVTVVDFGNKTEDFAKGTIGEMNDLGFAELDITDWTLDRLVEFGRRSVKE